MRTQNLSGKTDAQGADSSESRQLRIEQALKTLSKNLNVIGIRTTNLASITYESTSPQVAADIANGVAQAFINYTVEQKRLKVEQARKLNYEKWKKFRSR